MATKPAQIRERWIGIAAIQEPLDFCMGFCYVPGMEKRAALYLRVSTNEQRTENQRIELERVAKRSGWKVAAVYDKGISGAKGRDQRPEFNRMQEDATRRKFDIVAAWSVDRLGRSLQDLLGFLGAKRIACVNVCTLSKTSCGKRTPSSTSALIRYHDPDDSVSMVDGVCGGASRAGRAFPRSGESHRPLRWPRAHLVGAARAGRKARR